MRTYCETCFRHFNPSLTFLDKAVRLPVECIAIKGSTRVGALLSYSKLGCKMTYSDTVSMH
jgi:hypothetical protein